MLPTPSISGLASGLDTTALINAIIQVERQPILVMQNRQAMKTTQLTAWKSVQAMLVSLQTTTNQIKKESTFTAAISAVSTNSDFITATASDDAAFGTYDLTVQQLAQNHQIASRGYDDSDQTSFGTGTIQVRVGDTSKTIAIDSGEDTTLEGIRDAINDANAGVVASIIDNGAGDYNKQLILTAKDTGAENAITVTADLSGGQDSLSFSSPGSATASSWSGNSTTTVSTPGAYQGTLPNTYTFTVGTFDPAVIGAPDLGSWTGGTPTLSGDYTGATDKTYDFNVISGGTIGTDTVEIVWNDGENAETITLDASYNGDPIVVGSEGVTLQFNVGDSVVANESFSAEMETGYGLVGSDTQDLTVTWQDLYGNSGSFDLDAAYNAGDSIDLGDGLQVAFSSGSLESGDQFSLDVTPGSGVNTIQEAQDAIVQFGSGDGGGNPILVRSSTNQITDLIEGVTLDLHGADAEESIKLTVSRDDSAIVDSVQTFVDRYNELMEFLNNQFDYDPDLEVGGVLLGDSSLLTVQTQVRAMVTGNQPDMSSDIRALSQIGIRSGDDGTLSFDQAKFKEELKGDFTSVVALFAEVGDATDDDIRYVGSSAETVTEGTGYRVEVTRAATHAERVGETIEVSASDPLTIDAAHKKMRFSIDGRDSGMFNLEEGSYSSGEELAAMIEESLYEQSSLGARDVEVVWEEDSGNPDQGHLVIRSLSWGSDSSVKLEAPPSSANNLLSLGTSGSTSGVDVQGRINGIIADGKGRVLTSDSGNSKGLQVEILLTADELATQGSSQGYVSFTRGMGFRLNELLDSYNEDDGLVGGRVGSLQDQIDLLADQIDSMEERIAKRQETLTAQFLAMESAMGALQSQSAFLTAQLDGLDNLNQAIAAK
jgi:flagellar hook-associated protein 2